jgi:hypothetical protein
MLTEIRTFLNSSEVDFLNEISHPWSGLVIVKFSRTFGERVSLFAGEYGVTIGGAVYVYASTGFAVAEFMNCIPTTAENRSTKMKDIVRNVFFFTVNP